MPTSRLLNILFQPCSNLVGFRGFLAKYLASAIAALIDNWHSIAVSSFFKVAVAASKAVMAHWGGVCVYLGLEQMVSTPIPPISSPSATSVRWVAKHNRFYAPGSCCCILSANSNPSLSLG